MGDQRAPQRGAEWVMNTNGHCSLRHSSSTGGVYRQNAVREENSSMLSQTIIRRTILSAALDPRLLSFGIGVGMTTNAQEL